MRLLNTSTLALHEFFDQAIPRYAILSHRWEGEEVTFQDLQAGNGPRMKGFRKIEGCCQQAVLDGWEYAWIDSCCIDKTSSVELSEAINSMFEWYKRSIVCYVYLSDVPYSASEPSEAHLKVRESKWWTRGWTLQELIAPRNVIFYNCEWGEIGTKRSMEVLISSITRIARKHLRDHSNASVAQKMSWASERKTTRKEDEAYCLMGIFDVHMPLLYGEGRKAFRRLQLEILASSNDESLLAWAAGLFTYPTGALLAFSPAAFYDAGGIVRAEIDKNRPPFSMTNKGLRIELFLLREKETSRILAPLNCVNTRKGGNVVALWLSKAEPRNEDARDNEYHRDAWLKGISKVPSFQGRRNVLFLTDEKFIYPYTPRRVIFDINTHSLLRHGFTLLQEHACDSFKKTEIREIGSSTKGVETLKVSMWDIDVCCKFKSRMPGDSTSQSIRSQAEKRDSFVLILEGEVDGGEPVSVNILITEENEPVEADVQKLLEMGEWRRGLDRISRTMRSGRYVSVALRRRWSEGPLLYLVDITIDPEGGLPWPDLG
jgi:Heterokaryon incompatibility protein (HET)